MLESKLCNYLPVLVILMSLLSCKEKSQAILLTSSAELGHYLFFDSLLSFDRSLSCATCHDPRFAFTDGYRRSFNSKGDRLASNSLSVLNLQDYSYYSWSDSHLTTLHTQMLRPLFSESPVEMGLHLDSSHILKELNEKYILTSGFQGHNEFNLHDVRVAISNYLWGLQSRNSRIDQIQFKKDCASIPEVVHQSWNVYFQRGCQKCHGGRDFNVPEDDMMIKTKYRVPSLRNLNMTRPYFHNGQATRLREVLQCHAAIVPESSFAFDEMKVEEHRLIMLFLESLEDSTFLENPYFRPPKV